MLEIRLCSLKRSNDEIRFIDNKGVNFKVSNAFVRNWKRQHSGATKEDLENELKINLPSISNTDIYIHVYDFDSVELAILCTRRGIPPDRDDWWIRKEIPPELNND